MALTYLYTSIMNATLPPEHLWCLERCYKLYYVLVKQVEAMLEARSELTSLQLGPHAAPWVHAGVGGGLSKMTTLRRLSINPNMQVDTRLSSEL